MNSTMFIFPILWSIIVLMTCMTSDAAVLDGKGLLINCGLFNSTNSKSSLDGRVWQSDDDPAFAPTNLKTVSTTVAIADATDLPYKTARVFWSEITYSFSISPGPKFIRVYFFPNVSFNNTLPHQFSTFLFANNFTLLNDFNPFMNSPQNNLKYEFQVILENGENNLNLTFSPGATNDTNPISYGYVNGIEIESIPEGLYINGSNLNYIYVTDKITDIMNINFDAFQTAYRVNVGGEKVEESEDNPGGMKRRWVADDEYVVGDRGVKMQPIRASNLTVNYTQKTPPYVAPEIVYETARIMGDNFVGQSLMWVFEVDLGFNYVVRLHFCDLYYGGWNMYVYIGGYLAEEDLNITAEAGGHDIPMYKDYVITMPGNTNGSKVALSVALQPHNIDYYADVSLSGLEILKLSDGDNLGVPNPPYNGSETIPLNQTPRLARPTNANLKRNTHDIIIGGSIGGSLLVFVILLALLRRCRVKSSTTTTKTNYSRQPLSSDTCRRFSLNQIRVATRDFDQNSIIGRGGFGKVYKGSIDGGATDVAVKRLNSTSKQGEQEFLTEIEMLSRLRHRHLVSLIGYCDEKGEMILIYEYMPHGTLRDHLNYRDSKRTNNGEVLSWKQRLAICLGSARGLEYLHVGTKQLIIHRDVKSTNILLDDKWTAKVSDFGLSKGLASDTGVAHVSTTVKGSFGYLDPDYYQRGQLTEKSDIYSFGVMLFEVLCARPAVELNLPKVRACYTKGTLDTLVDPTLTGQITPECLTKFGETAELCIRVDRDERPSSRDVVRSLEFMLTLQQTAENTIADGSPTVDFITISSNATCGGENDASTSSFGEYICESRVATNAAVTTSHMNVKSGSVFSEIFDLRAR